MKSSSVWPGPDEVLVAESLRGIGVSSSLDLAKILALGAGRSLIWEMYGLVRKLIGMRDSAPVVSRRLGDQLGVGRCAVSADAFVYREEAG